MPFPNQGNTRYIDVSERSVPWRAVPEKVRETVQVEQDKRPGYSVQRSKVTAIYGLYRVTLVSPDRKHTVQFRIDFQSGLATVVAK